MDKEILQNDRREGWAFCNSSLQFYFTCIVTIKTIRNRIRRINTLFFKFHSKSSVSWFKCFIASYLSCCLLLPIYIAGSIYLKVIDRMVCFWPDKVFQGDNPRSCYFCHLQEGLPIPAIVAVLQYAGFHRWKAYEIYRSFKGKNFEFLVVADPFQSFARHTTPLRYYIRPFCLKNLLHEYSELNPW